MSPSPQPKLLYFAERHPTLDPAAFVSRWRQHGRLGMSLPRWRNIARYLQCDTIRTPGLPASLACDGVAIVVYRSETHRLAHLADRDAGQVTKDDEREAFARPVANCAVLTDEHALARGDLPPCKLFLRLERAAGIAADGFARRWLAEAGPRILSAVVHRGLATGYLQNHARLLLPETPPLCDAVDEIDCAEPAATCAALLPVLEELRHLATAQLVATRPVLLHAAPAPD